MEFEIGRLYQVTDLAPPPLTAWDARLFKVLNKVQPNDVEWKAEIDTEVSIDLDVGDIFMFIGFEPIAPSDPASWYLVVMMNENIWVTNYPVADLSRGVEIRMVG